MKKLRRIHCVYKGKKLISCHRNNRLAKKNAKRIGGAVRLNRQPHKQA